MEEPNLQYELPYLGADEVLEEVITLLAKMENDRQEKRSQLKAERGRYLTLKNKIDQHCMRKLKEIPKVVQAGVYCNSLPFYCNAENGKPV